MIFKQQYFRSITAKQIIFLICFIMQLTFVNAQEEKGITNNGARLVVNTGAIIKITGTATEANYTNRTIGSTHGRIDIDGIIKLQGNWANEATSGNVFINVDTDGEVIFNGSSIQSIAGSYVSSFEKLTINNTSGLSLSRNINVYGALTLTSGNITLNNYNLSLQTTGSITAGAFGATKMIVTNGTGSLRKYFSSTGSFTFPIGETTETPEYSPVSFTLTGGSSFSSAYVGAKVTDTKHPNNGSTSEYLTRYWSLSSSGITSPVYNANFNYLDADIVGTEASIYSAQYNGSTRSLYSVVTAASNQVNVTGLSTFYDYTGVDGTSPGVALTSGVPAKTNAAFSVTFTFIESVTGFDIGDISVTNATKSAFSGSGSVYTATITPSSNGAVTVKVLAGAAQDAATNQNTLSNTISTIYDNIQPGITLTPTLPARTNAPFSVTFTFTESVTGFDIGDISVTNAAKSAFSGSGSVYTATITPSAIGTVTVKVLAGVAQDDATNQNTLSNTLSTIYDNVKPTPTFTSTATSPTNLKPFVLQIKFSEKITGSSFGLEDLVISNATKSDLTPVVTDSIWTVNISPSTDGIVTVNMAAGLVTDYAGNTNNEASQYSITYDGTKPNVTITSTEPNPTKNSTFIATITFSENVTGFASGNITVSNGSVTGLSNVTPNQVWNATITPTTNGLVTVNIAAGVVPDNAGNTNTAATQFSITYDAVAPTVLTYNPSDDDTAVPLASNLEIVFNEIVNIGTGNITIYNSTTTSNHEVIDVTSIKVTGSGTNTITINPGANYSSSNNYFILIDNTAFKDNAGNNYAGIAVGTTWNFTAIDANSPYILTVSPLDNSTGVGLSTNLVITFSEIVNAVSSKYINIWNATTSTIHESILTTDPKVTGSGSATITINPSINFVGESNYYILIDAGAYQDVTSNPFAGISTTSYWNFTTADVSAPTISILNPLNGSTDVTVSSNLVITFNEIVNKNTGFITIMNATTSSVHEAINVTSGMITGGGTTSITINPTSDFSSESEYYVLIDNGTLRDASNNNFTGISNSTTWSFTSEDIIAPTVTVSSSEPDPTNNMFEVTIEFSEDVQDFSSGDISKNNGNLSDFNKINDYTFTVNVTPIANGIVSVQVTEAVCQDLAGNNNTASNIFGIEYDNVQPTILISTLEASPTNNSLFDIQIDFSEEVSDFTSDDIIVVNGILSDFINVNDVKYTAKIAPITNGSVTVNINSGVAIDNAGNNNIAATELSLTFDNIYPTVVITSSEQNPTNNSVFEVTLTFSEEVTSFIAADIQVTNGTPSNLQTSDNIVFTADITASASNIALQLLNGETFDLAGNENSTSNLFEIVYDNSQPTVEISCTEPNPVFNSPFEITITFSEKIESFDVGDVIAVNGNVSNMNTTDYIVYTVDITPVIVGTVTVDINAGVVSDLAGNGNTAATQFNIEFAGSKPEVIISSITTSPTNLSSIFLDIVFTESVNGFDESDIQVTNGVITNLTTTNNINFAVTLLPDIEGEVTAYIPADVAINSIANGNSASNTFIIIYDITAPSVEINSSEVSPTNSNSIPLTIIFSENVIGFELGDIAVQNGSVSGISNIDNVYSVTLIPSGDGIVRVNIAADVATDLAVNNNTVSTEFSIIYDGTSPTVTISSITPNPTNTSPIPVTITFSEQITGFVLGDISFTNGTSLSLNTSDNIIFTLNVTPAIDGEVRVSIDSDVCADLAGNNNSASTQFSITFDNASPSIAITSTESSPTTNNSIPLTITFSELVTGFDIFDITVGNGSVSALSNTDNVYTTILTPLSSGIVTVNIAAGVVTDLVGNNNTAASQFAITYDPTVGIDNVDQYQIMIYSNQGEVIIEISNPNNINFQNGQIEIFNTIGVPVLIKQMDSFSKQRIPINNVSTVYIVKLNLDGKVYMKKVFVNR